MDGGVDVVAVVLVGAVVALMSASAFAKLAYWEDTVGWFAELFPVVPPARAAVVVVTMEALLTAGVIAVPRIGSATTALWLVMASGVLAAARRRVTTCGCFGKRQRLGAGVAVRNAVSIALAVAAAIVAAPDAPAAAGVSLAGAVAGIGVIALREAADRRGVVV